MTNARFVSFLGFPDPVLNGYQNLFTTLPKLEFWVKMIKLPPLHGIAKCWGEYIWGGPEFNQKNSAVMYGVLMNIGKMPWLRYFVFTCCFSCLYLLSEHTRLRMHSWSMDLGAPHRQKSVIFFDLTCIFVLFFVVIGQQWKIFSLMCRQNSNRCQSSSTKLMFEGLFARLSRNTREGYVSACCYCPSPKYKLNKSTF